MKRALILLGAVTLTGCGQGEFDDLKQFMEQAGKGRQPALEPMPPMRQTESITYTAESLADPFKPRKMRPEGVGGGGNAPDLNRPKGPLESFPLDALRMVGTLKKGGHLYALVKTPENALYKVKRGDYMGQNFGLVVAITDAGIELKETVQDGTGDWIDSKAQVALQE